MGGSGAAGMFAPAPSAGTAAQLLQAAIAGATRNSHPQAAAAGTAAGPPSSQSSRGRNQALYSATATNHCSPKTPRGRTAGNHCSCRLVLAPGSANCCRLGGTANRAGRPVLAPRFIFCARATVCAAKPENGPQPWQRGQNHWSQPPRPDGRREPRSAGPCCRPLPAAAAAGQAPQPAAAARHCRRSPGVAPTVFGAQTGRAPRGGHLRGKNREQQRAGMARLRARKPGRNPLQTPFAARGGGATRALSFARMRGGPRKTPRPPNRPPIPRAVGRFAARAGA